MAGSLRIARPFGIDLRIHWTFLFIVLLVGFQSAGGPPGARVAGVVFGLLLVGLLFLCVTLHEFGHALVARRYGIPVREIVLLPIGGVAIMSRNPENPKQELWIAVAGPLVNVAILAVLVPVWLATGGDARHLLDVVFRATRVIAATDASPAFAMLTLLLAANAMLILFNLIPAFPLDGGRIFRALLAFNMPHPRATRIAARVGQVAAVGLALYGLMTGHFLMAIIAFFIFNGAGAESAASRAGTVLATRRAGDAYNKTAITLTLDHRVSHVIEALLTSYQPDFAVMNRGRLAGVVTRDDVLRWLAETPSLYDVYVTEVMREEPQVAKVDARLTLDEVTAVMADRETRIVAVFDGDHYLGLVSAEDISEAQAVLTFLNRRLQDGAPPDRGGWPVPMRQEVPRA
ncbi:MAG: peptidase [Phycisphaerales bacterium]|nr:peptidase [Phycisphaerales bacterium]